ncbi:hypothetical protein L208DRAFT_522669 [Tricholoma matsutake]|nr:hypothetical protein L208DRAFT_522669 [Tricholoma matsutake 945]
MVYPCTMISHVRSFRTHQCRVLGFVPDVYVLSYVRLSIWQCTSLPAAESITMPALHMLVIFRICNLICTPSFKFLTQGMAVRCTCPSPSAATPLARTFFTRTETPEFLPFVIHCSRGTCACNTVLSRTLRASDSTFKFRFNKSNQHESPKFLNRDRALTVRVTSIHRRFKGDESELNRS